MIPHLNVCPTETIMASAAGQLLGFFLGLLGFVGTAVATVLPHWHSTAYVGTAVATALPQWHSTADVGSNIITATGHMKGLWMECVWHSTGIYQCELHSSLLALPQDLQAARALMVLSCVTSVLASLVSVMGMKCTRFAPGLPIKSPLVMSGGICFLCAGLLSLITVSWTTNDVMMDFSDPFLPSGQKYEIGLAVYLGYASACLSLSGGLVLCCCSSGDKSRSVPPIPRSRPSSPPPAFNHIYPPSPPYKPPEALKDNRSPSFCSVSSTGYRLQNYV